jgi:hypothetical protein
LFLDETDALLVSEAKLETAMIGMPTSKLDLYCRDWSSIEDWRFWPQI